METSVLVVIDMQRGVFAQPRFDQAGRVERINQLIAAAHQTIFIQHVEGEMQPDSEAWQLLPEIEQPANALYINKTACDSFWHTTLEAQLAAGAHRGFVICGCATDYCVDCTVKTAATKGFRVTVAADAHTTADRTFASAEQLIGQHNEVWASLSLPGNAIQVVESAAILQQWRS